MFSFLILSMIHVQQTMEIVAQQREREIEIARAKDRDRLARQKKKMEVRFFMLFVLVGRPKESKREQRRRLHGLGRC
jgi:response regulator of citrate/malate metabolism